MKIKLGEIVLADKTFAKLVKIDLPFKTSYLLTKIVKKLSDEITFIDIKRKELFEKLGVKDDKGISTIPEDKKQEFLTSLEEILQMEVDIAIPKISLDSLDNISLSVTDILLIQKFFDENTV